MTGGTFHRRFACSRKLKADCAPAGPDDDAHEYSEAVGLLGRAYKQQYVDAGHPEIYRNRATLETAVDHYASIYEADTNKLWHGVNTFALLARAKHDEIPIGDRRDERAERIASAIEESLEDKEGQGELTTWDLATGVELYCGLALATDNHEQRVDLFTKAEKYLEEYSKDKNTDAFELASTLRQLEEVWLLGDNADEGSRIVPGLELALLACDGGALVGTATSLDSALKTNGLERVFGEGSFVTADWIDLCQRRLRCVGRINAGSGRVVGTGFLVMGELLSPKLGGQKLLLTNNHVVRSNLDGSMYPKGANVRFEAANQTVALAHIVWESPESALDATLSTLDIDDAALPDPVTSFGAVPARTDAAKAKAYILGHPKGNSLSVSINDNHLLDLDDRVMHYRTPTEPGSSGSPVFDEDWDLIGLHHKGLDEMDKLNDQDGSYEANEGIRIDRIRQAVSEELAGVVDLTASALAAEPPAASPQRIGLRTVCDLDLRDAELRENEEPEPGDIVVFRANNNWISQLISKLDGHWSHSSISVGNGEIAHSYSAGYGIMSLAEVASYYDEGYAVARLNRPQGERAAAAARARELVARGTGEYSGQDLGLAFALLCRIKVRDLLQPDMSLPDDDGLEAMIQRADLEATCSGFVYSCFERPLHIVPAPGLRLDDGLLRVVRNTDGMESLDDLTLLEALARDEAGFESLSLPNWKTLKEKLGFLVGPGIGIAKSILDGNQLRIEQGVTPSDLWCSPEIGDRWFLDAKGREVAEERSAHCPVSAR